MTIIDQEALQVRGEKLHEKSLNGIRLVLVNLQPQPSPTIAVLTVEFFNSLHLHDLAAAVQADPSSATALFPLYGGQRLPAGPLNGQVQVNSASEDPVNDKVLRLTVAPIGDYSTYTLSITHPGIDPLLADIQFKFRPGCFNNCPPDWEPAQPRSPAPPIDYLAKDFDSFRHTLIAWMMQRVPHWQPTSAADLDMVLLELFSAAADELSDYQDRVMNEAYLTSARKRVSLARHARLMDYHIHQGNQASTLLALHVGETLELPAASLDDPRVGLLVWTGESPERGVVFTNHHPARLDPVGNELELYTWNDTILALEAGSTQADLLPGSGDHPTGQTQAQALEALSRAGTITHLLIQEHRNPATGTENGANPRKRQVVRLLPGEAGATARQDPVTGTWIVRVRWQEQDMLRERYCFSVHCPSTAKPGETETVRKISLFHANLIEVYHGAPRYIVFKDPADPLLAVNELHYERDRSGAAICRLPELFLAYRDTPPGGETPPKSTILLKVAENIGENNWEESASLVNVDSSDDSGRKFMVETDERGRSLIRTGNGVNGQRIPEGASIRCLYQVGRGLDGNTGADKLVNFSVPGITTIQKVWNPFDAGNGREPEPTAEILRRVPEAYRARQLRAITLKDYVDRVQEVPEVSRAVARYQWTGSWRTVRIAVDPRGQTSLSDELRDKILAHLEAVRLIGEDIELRPPLFVPLEIHVGVCLQANALPADVRARLEQEFSSGYTPDGRPAFFHPDQWTFGQALHDSQVLGRAQRVPGVDHVQAISIRRADRLGAHTPDVIEAQVNEILQARSDPDHREQGFIEFHIEGGRA